MLFALSLLLPLPAFFFWLFWRLSPARADPRPVRRFNLAAVAVAPPPRDLSQTRF